MPIRVDGKVIGLSPQTCPQTLELESGTRPVEPSLGGLAAAPSLVQGSERARAGQGSTQG